MEYAYLDNSTCETQSVTAGTRIASSLGTMVRLTAERRRVFGERLLDLANYAAVALIFSQVVGSQLTSWTVALAGFALWMVLASLSFWLIGGA